MEESTEIEHDDVIVTKDLQTEAGNNVLKVNPSDFDYDEVNDTILPKNVQDFDKLIEEHPSVNTLKRDDKRESKVSNLKKKILDTLKVEEKKRRDLSCESVKSGCSGWGQGGEGSDRELSPSRGATRPRSDDEEDSKPLKSRRQSRPVLKPPKIVLSQKEK